MRIAILIKRTPDTEMRFSIAADGKSLDATGLKHDISDFDGYAVEVALRLIEQHGGETVVMTLGPDTAQEQLRKALSMGVDRAVQLKADAVPFDNFAIASALASELKDGGFDLILFGRQATDSAAGAVGVMTALIGGPFFIYLVRWRVKR